MNKSRDILIQILAALASLLSLSISSLVSYAITLDGLFVFSILDQMYVTLSGYFSFCFNFKENVCQSLAKIK